MLHKLILIRDGGRDEPPPGMERRTTHYVLLLNSVGKKMQVRTLGKREANT